MYEVSCPNMTAPHPNRTDHRLPCRLPKLFKSLQSICRQCDKTGGHEKGAATAHSFWYTALEMRCVMPLANMHSASSSRRSIAIFSRLAPARCALMMSAAAASTSCKQGGTREYDRVD